MSATDSSSAATAAEIRDWLRGVLRDKGLTPPQWAKQAGVAASTIQRALKDDYAFVTSSRTLAKLADAAHVEAPAFAKRTDNGAMRFLPVRYRVQAGLWYEADEAVQGFLGEHPVSPDPRFAAWPQWLEQVVGDSVNQRIPDGGFAHVIDAIEMGYAPRDGDFVVVERRMNGGLVRERTIKQVALRSGGVELWPRSTNPKWSTPVVLDAAAKGAEIEVEIVGLVVGFYLPLTA